MSEYQYYEFQAIDRPLTVEEQQAVSKLSSRVAPHPRRAVFTYSYSSFPGRAIDILARYYDAHFHIANWGSVHLIFRFPQSLIDTQHFAPYYMDEYVTHQTREEYVVLAMKIFSEEGFGWIEGEGYLDRLLALRDDILRQDYRALYLAWLAAVRLEDTADDLREPPVPPGLKELTPALSAFIEVFRIDEHLVTAAARASPTLKQESAADFQQAIASLPHEVGNSWLLRLAQNEAHLGLAFQRYLSRKTLQQPERGQRTVSELWQAAEVEQERSLKRQLAEAEAQRIRELEALAPKAKDAWIFAEQLMERSNARAYDEAVQLLVKLHDLAIHLGTETAYEERIGPIRQRYERRLSLLRRLDEAGLP